MKGKGLEKGLVSVATGIVLFRLMEEKAKNSEYK